MADRETVLSNEWLNLCVSSLGAEMQHLRTANGADLLWHGDAAFWTGRAPVLFPIVGRAANDQIAVGSHQASMSQHGFARRSEFVLSDHGPQSCTHTLVANETTKAMYPFAFGLHITHRLDDRTLTVSARVENQGDQPMPFGFGFHPAFRWPLPGEEDAPHFVTLASGGAPDRRKLTDGLLDRDLTPGPFVGGQLELSSDLFEDGALVFPNAAADLRYGPAHGPQLDFQFNNLPDFALWQPVGAPFLCIEPWHGTASLHGDGPEIAERPNSLTLDPDAHAEFAYAVTVTE